MRIDWSEWAKVSNWLNQGKNADPEIPGEYGVYMLRLAPACSVRGGEILYVGSTYSAKKVERNPDHFTRLRKRIGLFISCAMGFGTGHSAGCKFYDAFIKDDPPPDSLDRSGRDLRPTVRDVEVRWSVVDCPRCAALEVYRQTMPPPLFNAGTPKQCRRKDCPYSKRG
jgi:hypothetical protein